ncbi:MAG: hypothetical protein WC310_03405 [Patescibacteria group bacterium]|jgi:hypothetical protein
MKSPGGFEFRKSFDTYRRVSGAPDSGGVMGIEDEVDISDEARAASSGFVPDNRHSGLKGDFTETKFERIEQNDAKYPSNQKMYHDLAKIFHPDVTGDIDDRAIKKLNEIKVAADNGDPKALREMYQRLIFKINPDKQNDKTAA